MILHTRTRTNTNPNGTEANANACLDSLAALPYSKSLEFKQSVSSIINYDTVDLNYKSMVEQNQLFQRYFSEQVGAGRT